MAIKGNPFATPRKSPPRITPREYERLYRGTADDVQDPTGEALEKSGADSDNSASSISVAVATDDLAKGNAGKRQKGAYKAPKVSQKSVSGDEALENEPSLQTKKYDNAETLPGTLGETLPGTLGETLPGTLGETLPGTLGETLPGTLGETLPGTLGETLPGTLGETLPGTLGETLPGTLGETLPGTLGETLPGTLGETLPGTLGETLPGTLGETLPGTLGETLPGTLGETLPGTLGETLPGTLGETLPLGYGKNRSKNSRLDKDVFVQTSVSVRRDAKLSFAFSENSPRNRVLQFLALSARSSRQPRVTEPLSHKAMCQRLKISDANLKKILRRLADDEWITHDKTASKSGRHGWNCYQVKDDVVVYFLEGEER